MHLRELLRQRAFWTGAGLILALHLILLLCFTPLYDLDTNSYIRGGFTWDIYHNPLLNLYIAVLSRIWKNAWFLVAGQMAFYAVAASVFAWTVFPAQRPWRRAVLAIAALEPVTLFYHFSILAESFYISFLLLAVSFLIRWGRDGRWQDALLLGAALGMGFLAKLSGILHLALLGLMLFRAASAWRQRLAGMGLALLPFALCYLFVQQGQRIINAGQLYTVAGRVKWDFSSSQYRAEEVQGDLFKQYVHPWIYENGSLVQHRERRRELSHLGYKDCVHAWEYAPGGSEVRGIQVCDSLFGAVADQIMERHFWEVERQFVADNFRFVHTLNYLDYRFTPDLFFYHAASEWQYLDSLMETHYSLNLSRHPERIPVIWRDMRYGNVWMPLLWWLGWVAILAGGVRWLRRRRGWELVVPAFLCVIPWVFHLVYISYRPRFLAPYLVVVLTLAVSLVYEWTRSRSPEK